MLIPLLAASDVGSLADYALRVPLFWLLPPLWVIAIIGYVCATIHVRYRHTPHDEYKKELERIRAQPWKGSVHDKLLVVCIDTLGYAVIQGNRSMATLSAVGRWLWHKIRYEGSDVSYHNTFTLRSMIVGTLVMAIQIVLLATVGSVVALTLFVLGYTIALVWQIAFALIALHLFGVPTAIAVFIALHFLPKLPIFTGSGSSHHITQD